MTGCNPCPTIPCPHCDRTCTSIICQPCWATKYGTANAVAQLVRTPTPTDEIVHDMGGDRRCPTCGGPTCGEDRWCPKPFCRPA